MKLPGPIVSGEWLQANHEAVRLVDVRWSLADGPKRGAFDRGRLPGAVFADLDADLSAPPGVRGRHPLPDPERFAEVRARLDLVTRPVVCYDDQSGAVAARLWWMLDAIGHPAAVLDGGLEAWTDVAAMESGPSRFSTPVDLQVAVTPWPKDRFVDVDAVLPAIDDGVVLLDARSAGRFRGEKNDVDQRFGHIPGSVSRPWTDNIGSDGRFLPADVLREQLVNLGADPKRPMIASCGSGVTGCHDLLAARLAGLTAARLYTGSWSEWASEPSRPVATAADVEPDASY